MKRSTKWCLFSFFISIVFTSFSWACTGIQLKANDGSYINGRTVEFGLNLNLGGVVVPRNFPCKGTLPDGSTSMTYKTKYAAVGGGMFGATDIADGLNEKGLSIGSFYFPNYANYATITDANKNRALSPTEFANWVLTQFATVDEVKEGIKTVVIAPTTPKGWPVLPPFHYIVYDKTGKSLVIEPMNGQLKVWDNPLGVFTNSPTFDWHLTNLNNYINLSPFNVATAMLGNLALQSFGSGTGLHDIPGDFTPPSRFVRAAFYSATSIPADKAEQTVFRAFHILNQFDIPYGAVISINGDQKYPEYTLATTVKDTQNLKYYFHAFEDQTIKMVDLNAFDWNGKSIKTYSMQGNQTVQDISKTAV